MPWRTERKCSTKQMPSLHLVSLDVEEATMGIPNAVSLERLLNEDHLHPGVATPAVAKKSTWRGGDFCGKG